MGGVRDRQLRRVLLIPDMRMVPFFLVGSSLPLVYGLRLWPLRAMLVVFAS